ncbi:DUF2285 domain-containing protein [Aureimonas altamirensis]|uniref:DUF2285 domain-containing protein n=1 Tax=Aureimonas altamirensis TaxID=370622 RepID=UPI0033379EEC
MPSSWTHSYSAGVCDFPHDPDAPSDSQPLFWSPRLQPQAVILSPVENETDETEPVISLARLDGLDLRHAADGWHGIWQANGVAHQFWLPNATPDTTTLYVARVPLDAFIDLRSHAARRFLRSVEGRSPGPPFGKLPGQLRQWHILSLRALDAKLRGESYRTIAEVLLGFRGTKEDFESDPRKNKARRLVAHGLQMMHGGYRLLLHYPIKRGKS